MARHSGGSVNVRALVFTALFVLCSAGVFAEFFGEGSAGGGGGGEVA